MRTGVGREIDEKQKREGQMWTLHSRIFTRHYSGYDLQQNMSYARWQECVMFSIHICVPLTCQRSRQVCPSALNPACKLAVWILLYHYRHSYMYIQGVSLRTEHIMNQQGIWAVQHLAINLKDFATELICSSGLLQARPMLSLSSQG